MDLSDLFVQIQDPLYYAYSQEDLMDLGRSVISQYMSPDILITEYSVQINQGGL